MFHFELDVVDIAIIAVGLSILPILPDLMGNILVAVLPDSMITAQVLNLSRTIRVVTTRFVSFVLVTVSIFLPPLAVYFQPHMIRFRDSIPPPEPLPWTIERITCVSLALLVEFLYYKTVRSSPGYTPLGPACVTERKTKPAHEPQGSEGASRGDKGWCKRCDSAKPPRAHHCSVCGRCVLRMDHHCPFTSCCIGLLNERYFISWVFMVWLGCLWGSTASWDAFRLCIIAGLLGGIDSISGSDLTRCTDMEKAVFIFLPSATLLAFMTVLLGWHIFLIANDWTTIEFFRYRLAPLIGAGAAEGPAPETGRGGVAANFSAVLFPQGGSSGQGRARST